MCIIVYKPQGKQLPSTDTLRACWDNNPDGAGIMWPDGNHVNIKKGFMAWPSFLEALEEVTSSIDVASTPMALHFRIATHGAVVPGCCHPFAVKDSLAKMRMTEIGADVGFMHNGTLAGLDTNDATSDSMAFVKAVLVPLKDMSDDFLSDKRALRIIEGSTQGSRFLIMSKTGTVRLFGNWVKDHGILYSNKNFHTRYTYTPTLFDNSIYDAWAAFSNLDESLVRYGLFEACKDCSMLFDCAEYLPICTDALQASEMVASWA
ncbi:hypothetical protein [Adlercreutzia sp. ZJ138]|uniref:hypothetical protein n=1 Tax=Adlercreutzia sp. ZJ138 TaxID=2709405 RepID=UPI0013EDA694|nr:hypothetical protein [Adlercreutzia sp. ZJ138]